MSIKLGIKVEFANFADLIYADDITLFLSLNKETVPHLDSFG